jgi:hypothetical protein
MKTCIKFFCCSRMSFICATWMQDVTQSNIFSCGTDTSLISSDSADKQVYAQTTSLYSQYTQVHICQVNDSHRAEEILAD